MSMVATTSFFRVLVRADAFDAVAVSAELYTLGGQKWVLLEGDDASAVMVSQRYTCVSYAWGDVRQPHPRHPAVMISDRALAVAETAIAVLAPSALWIDALCVPPSGPARAECLRQLGSIYARASQVVAVLSAPCAPAIDLLANGNHVGLKPDCLEADDWVARAWTYQEIMNSQEMHLAAEGGRVALTAMEFLNGIGHYLVDRGRALGNDAFELKTLYPHLDALQELMVEWQIGDALQRPVFQLIAGMTERRAMQEHERLDALLGMVEDASAASAPDARSLSSLESVLRACDAKLDFSYVYAVSTRSSEAGRSWRPTPPGPLRAPIQWHSYGEGQTGTLFSTHLRLDRVCVLTPGRLTDAGCEHLCQWLGMDRQAFDAQAATEQTDRRMRDAGFTGSPHAIPVGAGIVLTQEAHVDALRLAVVVPLGIRWVHGAPALLVEAVGQDRLQFRDVGVFVGAVPEDERSVFLV
jgi:hypothetical protein